MPPQAAFKAALARSRHRDEQYHPYLSTRPSRPFQTTNASRLKQEPTAEDDIIMLDSIVKGDTKPNANRIRYSGGKGVEDAIELSDDEFAIPKNHLRMLTARQARQLADQSSTSKASRKAVENMVEKAIDSSNKAEPPLDSAHPRETVSEGLPKDTVSVETHDDTRNTVSESDTTQTLASSGPIIPNDSTVLEGIGTTLWNNDGNAEPHELYNEGNDSSSLYAGQDHVVQPAREDTSVAPTAYMGPRPPASVEVTRKEPSLISSTRGHTVNATLADAAPDTEALEAAEKERLNAKARVTLSQMKKFLTEGRKREQDRNLQSIKTYTYNSPERYPAGNAHDRPSGLRIRLASLGLDDSNILRANQSIEKEEDDDQKDQKNSQITPSQDFQLDAIRGAIRKNEEKAVSKRLSTFIEKASDIDKMILNMKLVQHKTYADTCKKYKAMTGRDTTVSTLSNRYRRLRTKLLESTTEAAESGAQGNLRESATPSISETPVNPFTSGQRSNSSFHRVSEKRIRDGPAITEWFQADKNSSFSNDRPYHKNITLKEGYFERHKQRIAALKAKTEWEYPSSSREDYFDGQQQSLFLSSESDEEKTAQVHSKTGGNAHAYLTPSQSELENEKLEIPSLLYEYQVSNRVQLAGESESQAHIMGFGPYYTLVEANSMAAKKARLPDLDYANIIFRPGAWSYNYDKDDAGMETHVYAGKVGTITSWVSRSIAPPEENIGVPLKAFTTPAWIYIAMVSSRNKSATEHAYVTEDNEVITLNERAPNSTIIKACTLLDLANRAAGEKWLELRLKDLRKDGLGDLQKAEIKMNIRLELEELDEKNTSFDRTYRDPKTAIETHIWVEMAEVEGPRN